LGSAQDQLAHKNGERRGPEWRPRLAFSGSRDTAPSRSVPTRVIRSESGELRLERNRIFRWELGMNSFLPPSRLRICVQIRPCSENPRSLIEERHVRPLHFVRQGGPLDEGHRLAESGLRTGKLMGSHLER
jgi:hypothetical protein